VAALKTHGPWPFALYRAFRFDGALHPIPRPRLPREDELVGYEDQLRALRENARRFLEGKPALHTLLYGARGTGKSTAAKSLLHLEGVRMVEVEPRALSQLEGLLETLGQLPHRLFLFLDDLSLDPEGEAFHHLKALLEGSLEGPPENVLLLATSNRRHLVRRQGENPLPGEAPEAWDELQDTLALAERFGLVLTFPPFDQALYLKAVAHHLGRPLTEGGKEGGPPLRPEPGLFRAGGEAGGPFPFLSARPWVSQHGVPKLGLKAFLGPPCWRKPAWGGISPPRRTLWRPPRSRRRAARGAWGGS